jgi:mono/diheme cytochrome c family protein
MLRTIVVASIALVGLFGAGLALSVAGEEPQGDFARGAKYYSDNCARCHKARPPMDHRARDWSLVVPHMRIVAALPGQQARDIQEFLRRSSVPPPTQ